MYTKINIELFDNSTGELIANNLSCQNINTGLIDASGEKLLRRWFDSFLRGLQQEKSLTLHLEVTERKLEKEIELFKTEDIPYVFE